MSFEDICSHASTIVRDIAQSALPPEAYRQWASQANLEFVRRTKSVRRQYITDLADGTQEYRLPLDVDQIRKVHIDWTDYDTRLQLGFVEFDELYDSMSWDEEGTPNKWYLAHNQESIGLWPIPDQDVTDGLVIDYHGSGNTYLRAEKGPLQLTCNALQVTAGTMTLDAVNDPVYPANYLAGWEIRSEVSETLGEKALIVSNTVSTAGWTITFHPSITKALDDADTVVVTPVPNSPRGFHHYLINYVVAQALLRNDRTAEAKMHLDRFDEGVALCRDWSKPGQARAYHRVRATRYGDRRAC